MAKTEKQLIGQIGEDLACQFLKQNHFKIIDRNYRRPWGEIDVVARDNKVWHFVEVKTVTRRDLKDLESNGYQPEDNIHPWKVKRLHRAINTYLADQGIDEDDDWQIDAIAIYLNPDQQVLKIDFLPEIF